MLEFLPDPEHDMLIACLWSRWSGAGEPDLLYFAAINDEWTYPRPKSPQKGQ